MKTEDHQLMSGKQPWMDGKEASTRTKMEPTDDVDNNPDDTYVSNVVNFCIPISRAIPHIPVLYNILLAIVLGSRFFSLFLTTMYCLCTVLIVSLITLVCIWFGIQHGIL